MEVISGGLIGALWAFGSSEACGECGEKGLGMTAKDKVFLRALPLVFPNLFLELLGALPPKGSQHC